MKSFVLKLLLNVGLLLLGSLLFSLGFPSIFSDWGWAPFAWISLIPIVLLIRRIPWWASPLWGAFYGYITYALFNFWLSTFNPVSFVLVPVVYASWFFLLFPLLALADRCFLRYGWLAQFVIWCAFEIVRTKGFLGYSYGVLGYSQYRWTNLISIADIFGVMGVSVLVVFPSFLIGGWMLDKGIAKGFSESERPLFPRKWLIPTAFWLLAVVAANIYGVVSKVDYKDDPRWKPALVQHNVNTWLSGIDAWQVALDKLLLESKKALKEKPDAVIWSETSFVPAIEWHLKYRRDRAKVDLINRLRDFLRETDVPIIIGNNDSVEEDGERKDFNAVVLFDKDKIVDKYRKTHLVPFSEHFPYAKTFPRLMNYIQAQGTPLYGKGNKYSIFNLQNWGGPKVSPLICFEDTFGYIARIFVRNGAEVLVNLSNDSWSPEIACATQHIGIAVFRTVENRRSMVRSTTSGITSVIDPNGKILDKLPAFKQGYLMADVPIYTKRTTLYTRWGGWFEVFILTLAAAILAAAPIQLQSVKSVFFKRKNND